MLFKKFSIFSFIILSQLISPLTSALEAMNPVEIINLSEEGQTLSLSPQKNWFLRDTLDQTLDSKDERTIRKFENATPEEAKHYFYDYLVEKLGKEKADELAPSFFTKTYFGETSLFSEESLPYNAEDAPYWMGHLSNMIDYGSPGCEKTMENARKRWALRLQLLKPSEAFGAFAQHHFYSTKFEKEIQDFRSGNLSVDHPLSQFFSSENFLGELSENPNERETYLLSQSIGFLDHTMIQNLYDGANKIMGLSKSGDSLVIFGNTPYFLA